MKGQDFAVLIKNNSVVVAGDIPTVLYKIDMLSNKMVAEYLKEAEKGISAANWEILGGRQGRYKMFQRVYKTLAKQGMREYEGPIDNATTSGHLVDASLDYGYRLVITYENNLLALLKELEARTIAASLVAGKARKQTPVTSRSLTELSEKLKRMVEERKKNRQLSITATPSTEKTCKKCKIYTADPVALQACEWCGPKYKNFIPKEEEPQPIKPIKGTCENCQGNPEKGREKCKSCSSEEASLPATVEEKVPEKSCESCYHSSNKHANTHNAKCMKCVGFSEFLPLNKVGENR